MSGNVVELETPEDVRRVLLDILERLEAGEVRAVAFVATTDAGTMVPWWGAARALGPHAGSILRGAVAYLAAAMDAEAVG